MPIVLRSRTNPSSSTGTTHTVAKPAGTAAGDFLLMSVVINNDASNLAQPAPGWQLIRSGSINGDDNIALWYRVAGDSEPDNYTLTTNMSTVCGAGILCYYSDSGSAIDIEDAAAQNNAESTDRTYPSVTFTSEAGVLVCCHSQPISFGSTPAAGMTELWDSSFSTNRSYCMVQDISSSGATGTRVATGSAAISRCVSIALAEASVTRYPTPDLRSYTTTGSELVSDGAIEAAIPDDAAAGDLLIIHLSIDDDQTIGTPAGWTLVAEVAKATGGLKLYSKTAEEGDAGSDVAFTVGGTTTIVAACSAFVSRSGKRLQIGGTATADLEAAGILSMPSVTAGRPNALLAGFSSKAQTTGVEGTDNTGWWERYDSGASAVHGTMHTELLTDAGATGTRELNWLSGTYEATVAMITVEEVSEGILFDGYDLRAALTDWSLESNVRIADTTILTSDAKENLPILSDWIFRGGGLWSQEVDDVFGAACASAQDADSTFEIYIGETGAQVAYSSNATFVSGWTVVTTIDEVIRFKATISISGAPTRSAA